MKRWRGTVHLAALIEFRAVPLTIILFFFFFSPLRGGSIPLTHTNTAQMQANTHIVYHFSVTRVT